MEESFILNCGRNLSTNPKIDHAFMDDDGSSGLLNTVDYSRAVPRIHSPQINEFDSESLNFSFHGFYRGLTGIERSAVGDDGQVGAFFKNLCFAQW